MEPRVDVVETPEEFAAVAHLREWCHDSRECPICKAYAARDQRGSEARATIQLHRDSAAALDAAPAPGDAGGGDLSARLAEMSQAEDEASDGAVQERASRHARYAEDWETEARQNRRDLDAARADLLRIEELRADLAERLFASEAEIERLTDQRNSARRITGQRQAELDDARAEIEQLHGRLDESDRLVLRLEAERDELREEVDHWRRKRAAALDAAPAGTSGYIVTREDDRCAEAGCGHPRYDHTGQGGRCIEGRQKSTAAWRCDCRGFAEPAAAATSGEA